MEDLLELPMIPGFCEIMLDNGMYADLMSEIIGFTQQDFDTCYAQAEKLIYNGIEFKFIHYQDHLASKSKSNRTKDLLDFQQLSMLEEE